ncbi:MAG: hypothetical protein AAGU11_05830 [Syntrophobacteraceae bacterium]
MPLLCLKDGGHGETVPTLRTTHHPDRLPAVFSGCLFGMVHE